MKYKLKYYLLIFLIGCVVHPIFSQETEGEPISTPIEFESVDPNYSSSFRLETGLPVILANDALRKNYTGFYSVKLSFFKNLTKSIIFGPYVGQMVLNNFKPKQNLSSTKVDILNNTNLFSGIGFGYEMRPSKYSILSTTLNAGYTWIYYSREEKGSNEILNEYKTDALNLGTTVMWSYLIEDKFSVGTYFSYQFFGNIFQPGMLDITPDRTSKHTQTFTFGLLCSFGMGKKTL